MGGKSLRVEQTAPLLNLTHAMSTADRTVDTKTNMKNDFNFFKNNINSN